MDMKSKYLNAQFVSPDEMDMIMAVDDPGSTSISHKITVEDFFNVMKSDDKIPCPYCDTPNPKTIKLRSYSPEQEVVKCISCGAPLKEEK